MDKEQPSKRSKNQPITNFFSTCISSPKKAKGRQNMTETEEARSPKKENRSPKSPRSRKTAEKTEQQSEKQKPLKSEKEDYNEDLIPQRQPSPTPKKNPNIKREKIDTLVKSRRRDTEFYRQGYPGVPDDKTSNINVRFYKNELPSSPDGDLIDNIHTKWWGDYRKLEIHHGYIQWLFPIKESGMNYRAKELQSHEAQTIQADPECQRRFLMSYKMMLNFYGLKLLNEETGEVGREENWQERFAHLNRSYHNYLRITRILKSLGEFGFEKLKFNFLKFILNEIILEGTLQNCFESCIGFWIMVVKDDQQREELIELAKQYCDKHNEVGDTSSSAPSFPQEDDELMEENTRRRKVTNGSEEEVHNAHST